MAKKKVTSVEVLARATELLATPTNTRNGTGWIKGISAVDKKGRYVLPSEDSACRFCSLGAIDRAVFDLNAPMAVGIEAQQRLAAVVGSDIINANDDKKTTFRQIVFSFELAQTEAGNIKRSRK